MLRQRTVCTSWRTENAFLCPGGLVRSKIFTALSMEPEKSVGFMGWKAKQVTPSTWSCSVLVMGFMSSSSVMRMRASGPSVLTAQARMRAQSRILMLPSRNPVAQERPSGENATARHGQPCWCCAVYRRRTSGARRAPTPWTDCSWATEAAGAVPVAPEGCGAAAGPPERGASAGAAAAPAPSRSRTRSSAPRGGTGTQGTCAQSPPGSSPKAHFRLLP
mmetsp:Transcript_64779/g.200526  ORF Transcript_64779/g.200526 Transcript_64779/m.200526 type:complete len:219 (+) Transcript_64779:703-1359(+)